MDYRSLNSEYSFSRHYSAGYDALAIRRQALTGLGYEGSNDYKLKSKPERNYINI